MENCKNCEHQLDEANKFCPNCGQKALDRLRLRALLGDLASAFFAWDSKLFTTLKHLLFKPGYVAKEFVSGKRKKYVPPLRLYLFFSVLFFLLVATFGTRVEAAENNDADDGILNFSYSGDTVIMNRDSLILMAEHNQLDELEIIKNQENELAQYVMEQLIKITIDNGSFSSYLQKNFSFMFFFFIPVFGWVLKLFYRKKKYDFIEHLVYGLYLHSFIFFILTVTLLASKLVNGAWPLLIGIALLIVYFVVGVKRFYGAKWTPTILKSLFITILYLLFLGIFGLATMLFTILLY